MLQTLKLLLPALVPSWRFFDMVAPSPRIEISLLMDAQDDPVSWQEFRPRPQHVTVFTMLKRMFWNSEWNETLFLVSCSERLIVNPTEHSSQEILQRIRGGLAKNIESYKTTPYLQFRLVFLQREGTQIEKHILYVSPIHELLEGGVS